MNQMQGSMMQPQQPAYGTQQHNMNMNMMNNRMANMNFNAQQTSPGMRMQQQQPPMMQPQGMGGGMGGMRPMGQPPMMGGMSNMRMGGGNMGMGMGMNMQPGQMQSNNSQSFGQFKAM